MAGSIVEAARDRVKKRAEKEALTASAGEISEGERRSATPKLGRGLTFPTLDFKSFRTGLDERFFENEEGDKTDHEQIEEAASLEDLSEDDDDDLSIWDWSIGRRRSSIGDL